MLTFILGILRASISEIKYVSLDRYYKEDILIRTILK